MIQGKIDERNTTVIHKPKVKHLRNQTVEREKMGKKFQRVLKSYFNLESQMLERPNRDCMFTGGYPYREELSPFWSLLL